MKLTLIALLLVSAVFAVSGQNVSDTVFSQPASVRSDPGGSETSLPTLRGDAAIDTLKQRGQYDS